MSDRVRVFPAVEKRVETGAIQFGDDWPGIFIRGDNAMWLAMQIGHLEETLKGIPEAAAGTFMAMAQLSGIRQIIQGDVDVYATPRTPLAVEDPQP